MAPAVSDNVNSDRLVGESNESTCLVGRDTESQDPEGAGDSGRQDSDSDLWKEMDAPWPATFERAISLLASPVIKAQKAKDLTKSPKPGNTPVAIRRRMLVSYT